MALRLEKVSRRYGRHVALDGMSLHVRPGDCYGFLGHNGAGKTTALRIALGLIRPGSGRVVVDGFDACRYPREARARQGGLIERPGFYRGVTGRNNLAHLARLGGIARRDAAGEADRLLDVVGLSSDGDRKVGGYSQGMRQRLGIAQALIGSPSLILLDEPLNGLDPEGIEECRRLLIRLTKDEGRTVLLSSHQLGEVSGICNRIGILRNGRMLVEAETDALLDTAKRRYLVRTNDDAAAHGVLAECGLSSERIPEGGILVDVGDRPPAEISHGLMTAGLGIEELSPIATSLEEIYLRYSRGEAAPSRGEATDEAPTVAVAPRPAEQRSPPGPIRLAFGSEVRRLLFRPGPALVLLLPALIAALSVFGLWSEAQGWLAEVDGGDLFSSSLVTAFEGTAVALRDALPLAALLLAGLASQSLAGELSRGTLRNLLLRPIGRARLAIGKALGLLAAAAVCYTLMVGVAVGASALAFDFTDVVEILEIENAEPWVLTEASALWPPFRAMLPAMFLPLAAYLGLGFLCGAVARRGVTALALSAGAVVSIDIGRILGRALSFEHLLLSAYSPSPLGDTSRVVNLLDLIRAPNDPPAGYVDGSILVPAVWLVLSVLLAAWILTRRQVP